jgi:hypothetical protein
VKTGHHSNTLNRCAVDYAVRKSGNTGSTELPPYDLVLQWVLADRGQSTVNGVNEIDTEPRDLSLIPISGFCDIGLRLGLDDQIAVHL